MAHLELNGGGWLITNQPLKVLQDLLTEKTRIAGHMLTFDEAKADPTMVDPNVYAFYFGGRFTDFAKGIWSNVEAELATGQTKQEVRGMKVTYAEQDIKDILYRFHEEHGRWPIQKDIRAYHLPDWATIIRHIGSKENWTKAIYGEDSAVALAEAAEKAAKAKKHVTKVRKTAKTEVANSTEMDGVLVPDSPASDSPAPEIEPAATSKPSEPDSSPLVEANLTSPENTSKGVGIELKIMLPDREKPIILSLSF